MFEVEIIDMSRIKSRIVWPESTGPWIEGAVDDLMVHFAYAGWTAYMRDRAVSLLLTSPDENLGLAISSMLTKTMEAMGAVQIGEIRLNREALKELQRDRIEP